MVRRFFVSDMSLTVTLCNIMSPLTDATHIFDGLGNFPTHVGHMRLGSFVTEPTPWPFGEEKATEHSSALYGVALRWLRDDREHRRELEKNGRKLRGARPNEVSAHAAILFGSLNIIFAKVPADSETFYKK